MIKFLLGDRFKNYSYVHLRKDLLAGYCRNHCNSARYGIRYRQRSETGIWHLYGDYRRFPDLIAGRNEVFHQRADRCICSGIIWNSHAIRICEFDNSRIYGRSYACPYGAAQNRNDH